VGIKTGRHGHKLAQFQFSKLIGRRGGASEHVRPTSAPSETNSGPKTKRKLRSHRVGSRKRNFGGRQTHCKPQRRPS